VAPAAGLESGFATGVVKEGHPIPAVLDGHLRQEEAARHALFEKNPIPANDHLVEIDAPKWGEGGDLDVRVGEFVSLQRGKPGVLEGGGYGVVPDRSPQRRDADHMTDTTSQSTIDLESHKRAAGLEEDRVVGFWRGEGSPAQATLNRLAGESEQKPGRGNVDRVLTRTGNHLYQDGIVTP